jgi:hypothetical protein
MAKKRPSIIRQGRHADTSCGACGRPLTLFDDVTEVDGVTVCASGCLGSGIKRARQMPEYQDDPRRVAEQIAEAQDAAERCGSWFEDGDYGGAVDGLGNVSSDADPGL